MHAILNATRFQALAQFIPAAAKVFLINQNAVLVPSMLAIQRRRLRLDACDLAKACNQDVRVAATCGNHVGKALELLTTNGRFDICDAVVQAKLGVIIFVSHAMAAEQAHFGVQLSIIAGGHAAFANDHVLGQIERVANDIIPATNVLTVITSAMSLRRIPNDFEIMLARQPFNCRAVTRIAKQMEWGAALVREVTLLSASAKSIKNVSRSTW
jgi:hypothetical protein